jgi:NAD+ kinase
MTKLSIAKYLKNILIVYKEEECECTELVKNILIENKLKFKTIIRDNISKSNFKNIKLIISIGGDGTALKVAQFIKNNSLLLVVKNNSILSEGFLSQANIYDFEEKFKKIIKSKFKLRKLPRLEALINDVATNILAINEISITRIKPFQTLMYDLNKNIERATGILVSTPIGSTAWNLSAGGKKLDLNKKLFQFIIREPYKGKIYKVEKQQGFLKENESFIVRPITKGILAFDSTAKNIKFKSNDIIKIRKSKLSLNYIEF